MSKTLLPIAALMLLRTDLHITQAATLVVDNKNPQSADTNPGTHARPFETINAAAQKIQPGDSVLVRPGLYREAVTLRVFGSPLAPVTLQSEVSRQAMIDGADLVSDFKVESAGVWSFAAPELQKNPYGDDGNMGDWVYIDGAPLERVPERARLGAGGFWEDSNTKRVFFAPEEGKTATEVRV